MKRLDLKDKVAMAYLRRTGEPTGWTVFQEVAGSKTQMEIAQIFGVTLSTAQRWLSEFKQHITQ